MATVKKTPEKAKTEVSKAEDVPVFRSRAERLAAGKALRDSVPRNSHADWAPPANRRDPIAILEGSNQDRLPELVPIRFGRMLLSPFTFLRGSAALLCAPVAGYEDVFSHRGNDRRTTQTLCRGLRLDLSPRPCQIRGCRDH